MRFPSSACCVWIFAACLGLGVPARADGDLHERIQELTARLQAQPDQPALLLERAELCFQHQQHDQALVDLTAAQRLAPALAPYPLLRARSFYPAGFPLLAAAEIKPYLAEHPEDGHAWLILGRSLLMTHHMKDAALAYDQAVAHAPRLEPQLVLEQARAWAGSGPGGEEAALQRIETARERLGENVPALLECSVDLLARCGRLDEACIRLDRQIDQARRKDPLLLRKAQLLEQHQQKARAIAVLQTAAASFASLPDHMQQRPDVLQAQAEILAHVERLQKTSAPEAPEPRPESKP